MNPLKFWLIIKDDSKRTFEVIGQDSNTNSFTNLVYGMQRAKMSVTGVTPPVGGTFSTKESIKFSSYTKEDGLFKRLQETYRQLNAPTDFDE
jgi:hypothetical protein